MSQSTPGGVAVVSGKAESALQRKSTGGDSKAEGGLGKSKFSGKFGGKSKPAAEAAAAAAAAAEASTIAGLSKKERRALEEQQVRARARTRVCGAILYK